MEVFQNLIVILLFTNLSLCEHPLINRFRDLANYSTHHLNVTNHTGLFGFQPFLNRSDFKNLVSRVKYQKEKSDSHHHQEAPEEDYVPEINTIFAPYEYPPNHHISTVNHNTNSNSNSSSSITYFTHEQHEPKTHIKYSYDHNEDKSYTGSEMPPNHYNWCLCPCANQTEQVSYLKNHMTPSYNHSFLLPTDEKLETGQHQGSQQLVSKQHHVAPNHQVYNQTYYYAKPEVDELNNEPQINCNFHQTDCRFKNDDYKDSLFTYGYSKHFRSHSWHVESDGRETGWGRVVSPLYRWTFPDGEHWAKQELHGCIRVDFVFDSQGTDRLLVSLQDNHQTRQVLDYMHSRPEVHDKIVFHKYIRFLLHSSEVKFFIHLQFDSRDSYQWVIGDDHMAGQQNPMAHYPPPNHYALTTFQIYQGPCPKQ